jgi:hypothetical protein
MMIGAFAIHDREHAMPETGGDHTFVTVSFTDSRASSSTMNSGDHDAVRAYLSSTEMRRLRWTCGDSGGASLRRVVDPMLYELVQTARLLCERRPFDRSG